MNKWRLFMPLIIIITVSIALPERGLSAESPKIEKAALKRDFIGADQRYNYLFDFDFVNALAQPIEIVSVNVFDVRGGMVAQDWAISGPNYDPRLLTHKLSGNHPLVKIFSKPGRGTPLEQATVSSAGGRMEIKVTNRILSAGQAIRPSGYILGSKNKYDSLILRVAYRVNGNLQEVSHTFTVGLREEEKTPSAPVPQPVPTPTPPPSMSKKFRSIEEVDFANFTFPPVEDCGKNPASLKMGKYEDQEVHVQLTPEWVSPGKKVLYADLTGERVNQAIVPLYCDTYGNFFITEIFLYTLRNGEPVLIAKLPESIMGRDYNKYYPKGGTWGGISRVAANNGKLTFYKATDGYHACPENEVRFEYAWNGKSFVLSGKPVKRPLKKC